MTQPVRLRLSRAKGFDLQALSRATNGLEATKVTRPGRWGNPFKPQPAIDNPYVRAPALDAAACVTLYRQRLENMPAFVLDEFRVTLRARNLACWCALDAPCHADVLLDLVNRPICEAIG